MLFFYRFGAKDIIWQFAFVVIARNYCQNISNNSSNPSEILSLSAEIGVYCFGVIVILKHLYGFLFSVFYLPHFTSSMTSIARSFSFLSTEEFCRKCKRRCMRSEKNGRWWITAGGWSTGAISCTNCVDLINSRG